jgi:hypothetical protein
MCKANSLIKKKSSRTIHSKKSSRTIRTCIPKLNPSMQLVL